MARLCKLALFILLFQPLTAALADSLAGQPSAQALPVQPLTIVTMSGASLQFQVEIATREKDQARGLMYRKTMAPDAGMLFLWEGERPISMWMKNTYLSLDMLFINAQGVVVHIAPRTTPLSEEIIDSKQPVSGVLELLAGTAAASGIAVGSRVIHPHFGTTP